MILAVDAGGTFFRGEIYRDNELIKKMSIKSDETGLALWIESILQSYTDIRIICVAYAGQVKDGIIFTAPNIQIDKHEIKNYFENKYNVKLFIENDVNCAVLAEADYFNVSDICAIYVGTGIGLGVVNDSKLITGFNGIAAELGHIPYKKSPFICGCGKDNCIELFASGSALDRWKKYKGIENSLTLQKLKDSSKTFEIYEVFEEALLYAIATAITLFNPKVLVLGGGIIESNLQLHDIIVKNIKKYAMPLSLKHIQIKNTQLKDAPLKGALMLKDNYE